MPIRTCLVTGKTQEQDQLLRFTIQQGKLVFDNPRAFSPDSSGVRTDKPKKNPGRGGYVINDPKLIARLPKMKGKIAYYLQKPIDHISSDFLALEVLK